MNTLFILLDAAKSSQGNAFMSFLPLILIVVIFWLFIIRPQQKKQKEVQNFRNAIAVGSHVCTLGGIYGTVRRIDEQSGHLFLEVASGVTIEVDRNAVNPSAPEGK